MTYNSSDALSNLSTKWYTFFAAFFLTNETLSEHNLNKIGAI